MDFFPSDTKLDPILEQIAVVGKTPLIFINDTIPPWDGELTLALYEDVKAVHGAHYYYFNMNSGELIYSQFTWDTNPNMTFVGLFRNGLVSTTFKTTDFIIPGCSNVIPTTAMDVYNDFSTVIYGLAYNQG